MVAVSDDELLALLGAVDAEEGDMAEVLQTLATRVKDPLARQAAVNVEAFLEMAAPPTCTPILDVRSPGEFAQGHIPGAYNLPLFSDEERAEVGTAYTRRSREAAMQIGMRHVRPKIEALVATAQAIADKAPLLAVHCWRGGMRSGSVAWLLRRHGMEVVTLAGGYKAFRSWVNGYWGDIAMPTRREKKSQKRSKQGSIPEVALEQNIATDQLAEFRDDESEAPAATIVAARAVVGPRVCVIGGRTGVGKTRVLHALSNQLGQRVIDLEGLAKHRGSTFGWVGQGGTAQPTTEHFANELAVSWCRLAKESASNGNPGWLFIEDEDAHIGNVTLPAAVYAVLRCAPLVIRINVGETARVRLLVEDYTSTAAQGDNPASWLEGMQSSVRRLQKRLGGAAVQHLLQRLEEQDFEAVARALLGYYDKLYDLHVANSGGTGSGSGRRPGCVVDVSQADDLDCIDDLGLARLILERVAEFEMQEMGQSATVTSQENSENAGRESEGLLPAWTLAAQGAAAACFLFFFLCAPSPWGLLSTKWRRHGLLSWLFQLRQQQHRL